MNEIKLKWNEITTTLNNKCELAKTPLQYQTKVNLELVRLGLPICSLVTSPELSIERKRNLKFTNQSNNSFVYLYNLS